MTAPLTDPTGDVWVGIVRLDPDLDLPVRAHDTDAGLDLRAREDCTLAPGQRALVPTGVVIALPDGYAGFTHPRSGLAARHGVTIVNAPGTIDAGYRGEILVNLINLDRHETVTLRRGDRIAQLVVQPVARVAWREHSDVDSLGTTSRGDTGHGASGGFGYGDPPTGASVATHETD